jgi:(p)ppGpp synthase/HD superfamily hydrolase
MSTLERAIALAATAHEGQLDKAGAPYILHVLRVMLRLQTPEARMAAVLHDIVEDCGWTLDRLRADGFPEAVVTGIDAVTRREAESYEEFVLRAKAHPIGRLVKMADLEDNSDLTRLPEVTDRDRARLDKYRRAMEALSS